MQPVNFGNQQQYPAYPNCFDMLTTHGIIAEDLVGYVTDTPSPYLQNYVAQHSSALPTIPGRIMPDNLPALPQPKPLPKADSFQQVQQQTNIPKASELTPQMFNSKGNKNKWETAKKVAAGVLLISLVTYGAIKGKNLAAKIYNKIFRRTTTTP